MEANSFETLIMRFKNALNENSDVIVSQLDLGIKKVALVYIKGMIKSEVLNESIVSPLTKINSNCCLSPEALKKSLISAPISEIVASFDEALSKVLSFWVVIFVEGEEGFLCVDAAGYPVRLPSEPPTSPVLQGPREGFVEDINTNISLIRRRLKTANLKIIDVTVGRYTQSKVKLCYLTGIADKKIVKQIQKKLEKIDIDGILDSNYLVELLEPKPFSIFKQVGTSEKPDSVVAKVLEGRIAILVDGSPIVLTLPFVYLEDVQSSNDYYGKSQYATYMRLIRIIGILFSVVLPGAYLSVRLYHYKIIPLKLLITITNSTQNLPTTPFLELLFILLLFDVLYEVSLRLPRYLGLATSIVGALILGDTGVKAGLISPPGVMIIALSLISIYTVPDQLYQLSLLRLLFLFIGGTLGLFGIVAAIIFFTNHLNTFDCYGAAYLAPLAPYVKGDKKDGMFKSPLPEMKTRPRCFKNKNRVRQK